MRRTLIALSLAGLVAAISPLTALAATLPRLGTATSFTVLAGAGITNTGPTTITGDVGTFPTTSETGFGSVTILAGVNNMGNAVTQGAKNDLVTAYNDLAGQTPCPVFGVSPGSLDGRTLTPGCYKFSSSAILNVNQTLTLNGFGVYVFQVGSSLTIGNNTTVLLTNGAVACGIFWQVVISASIGSAPTNFQGTLIAGTSITVTTGANWTGRALARNGAVTMDTNTITKPAALCGALPISTGNTGIPAELVSEFPWLFVIGVGGGLGAVALGVSSARRRRRTT